MTTAEHSPAAAIGKAIEPVFAPLGFDWRVDIGLIGSFAAREVFVSTMGQVAAAEEAAIAGARDTAESTAKRGRASYVGDAAKGVIDPGAAAMALVIGAARAAAAEIAAALALFRDEATLSRWVRLAMPVLPVLAALVLGHAVDAATGGTTARLIALGAVVAGGVAERAIGPVARRRWWGTPLAWLALMTLGGIAGAPVIGLTLTALYASATLIAAVETLRRQA